MSKWTGWGLLLCFICFPEAIKQGVLKGLELGSHVLVPSIFPYLVVSGILFKTGALHSVSKKIKLGKLSESARELLIPSLFCGYPTGARMPSLAYHNGSITKREFTLLFLFSNIPGLGFCISYLGGLFHNRMLGACVYVSFLLASVTLLWFFSKDFPKQPISKSQNVSFLKTSDALVESVSESAQTMVSLLFFVCFFSAIIDLLQSFSLPQRFFPVCAAFLEITTGLSLLSQSYPMETVVFFCAFSGLSVMFQSLYFDKNHAVNFLRLLLGRTVYGMLSVFYFWILCCLFHVGTGVLC